MYLARRFKAMSKNLNDLLWGFIGVFDLVGATFKMLEIESDWVKGFERDGVPKHKQNMLVALGWYLHALKVHATSKDEENAMLVDLPIRALVNRVGPVEAQALISKKLREATEAHLTVRRSS